MNIRLLLVVLLIATSSLLAHAQKELDSKTLLTIDGKTYDAGTFKKVFLKNLDIVKDEAQKDIDNYLQLYIDYRIKLQQAKELGLDNKEAYIKELQGHRNNLSQSYLTDLEVTDALVKEAYERGLKDINANHILIRIEKTAKPADTIAAYNRIQEIYKSLQEGANFEEIAKAKSEDPGAGNGGKLGWFGTFRMIDAFEDVAYNTPVGKYSNPVRTDFGYHIIKINETRVNPGEVTVAHIMTFDPRESDEKTAAKRIQEVNTQLKQGKTFETLAREFSDDQNSAMQGGKLNRFGTGGLNSTTFENIAFNLKNPGDISEPFESEYGWHIVKLIEKHPVEPFESQKKTLTDKIKKSPRARKITETFTAKLVAKYKVKENQKVKNTLPTIITDSLLKGKWDYTENKTADKSILFNIQEQQFSKKDFYEFLVSYQVKDLNVYENATSKMLAGYDAFLEQSLIKYYDDNLERDNADFNFTYNEYKEGILLFNLLEERIWERAKKDSVGQKQYYDNHKFEYTWKRRLDINLFQNTSEETAKEVQQLLKNGKTPDEIKNIINTDGKTKVIVSSGKVEETFNRLPKDFVVQKGISDIYSESNSSFFKVIQVLSIDQPTLKTFDEARSNVINDYQQQIEKDWLANLRKNRNIEVNQEVLNQVKKELETRL